MDSADAAPPPKAPPLPEATTANTVTSPIVATPAPQEPSSTTTSSSTAPSVPISPTMMAPNSKASTTTTTTTTKKRPLPCATTHAGETLSGLTASSSTRLVPPTLKAKYEAKAAPTKAKKSLKKKTKKKKFRSILSGMMKPKELDIQAERESLRKNLGGGNFAKIDKI